MTEVNVLQAISWWLDHELDFGLDYEMSVTHNSDGSVLVFKINNEESSAWGDNWDRTLELLVRRIAWELNAWYSWKGLSIGLHLHCRTLNEIVLYFFRIYKVCLSFPDFRRTCYTSS